MSITQTIDNNSTAFEMPYVVKRSWILQINNSDATNREGFFAVQIELTDPTVLGTVVIETGHANNPNNIILCGFTGQIIPICGIGYLSTGSDINGFPITTSNVEEVIAFGGNKVDRFLS